MLDAGSFISEPVPISKQIAPSNRLQFADIFRLTRRCKISVYDILKIAHFLEIANIKGRTKRIATINVFDVETTFKLRIDFFVN